LLAGVYPLAAQNREAMTFSGTLEARQTRIAAEIGGRVTAVRVSRGDAVKSGDRLVILDDSAIQSALAEAEAAVRVAQANLDQVQEKARPGVIALAEAGVAQAGAELKAATLALTDATRALASPQELLSQLHLWEGKVQAAAGEVAQAEAAVSLLKSQVEMAEGDQSLAGKYRLAALRKQQEAAAASLSAAQTNQAGSQRVLDLYRQVLASPQELIVAQRAAAAQVLVAEAGVQVARAELALAQSPPQTEAVALAEARLQAAQAGLKLVQAQAKRFSLVSPVNGTVVGRSVEPGETVRPGSTLLTIADTREREITLVVPIRYLSQVHLQQPATVTLPSLPGRSFAGRVTYIAPEAEFKPANVYNSQERSEIVFTIRVTLLDDDPALKVGLPADVTLGL